MAEFSLSIDIGGTFTDIVLLETFSGRIEVNKTLTSYPDPSAGVLSGVARLLEEAEVSSGCINRVIHGTTLVTNALIERKGARTGLITTRGFRDALEIGREGRYDIYDLQLELPQPLVERRHRFEVNERVNPDGSVRIPIEQDSVEETCRLIEEAELDAVGVCFLHAYANPEHEVLVRKQVQERFPDCAISVSSEVAPELREFERTSTTVANAYVQPMVERYLSSLEVGLEKLGVLAPLHIMLSNGGSCTTETATRFPVRLVESGPCGGALAAAEWGRRMGLTHVFGFDMGGTTAKAILSVDGKFPITTESEVARVYRFKRGSGLPLLVPVLDMIEIGAGGGSIAHLNAMRLPTVGPESAGSSPGPACYKRGGKLPTVTDADLLLGFLNPDYFLGGKMALSEERARSAISSVAEEFGGDVVKAALGIHQLVNENMANAARVHAAERGMDLRSFALVATGGAGPVHACSVADRLGLRRVLIPPLAGVGSAFGLHLAPISFDFSRSYVTGIEGLVLDRLGSILEEMTASGRAMIGDAGVESDDIQYVYTADIRYVGQGHEISVSLPDRDLDARFGDRLVQAFEQKYTQLFGRICKGVPVEMVNWRVTVSGPSDHVDVAIESDGPVKETVDRPVIFDRTGPVITPVFSRYGLNIEKISGPAIIEEVESTAVIPPGWEAEVQPDGSLFISRIE